MPEGYLAEWRHDTQINDIQHKGLLIDILHNDTQHNNTAIMQNDAVLSVTFYLLSRISLCCHDECLYTEFHYAECHYAECHYAERHYAECYYAECHYDECHYVECHYADCHYAECCGAIRMT
jgi:hypothetical protein